MGWPQIIVISLFFLRLIVIAAKDGEPKEPDTYRFGASFMAVVIWTGLLWWGGFWSAA